MEQSSLAPSFWGLLAVLGFPMLPLSASVLTWHSLCVCVQVCPLLGRTLVIRLGPVPIQCDLNLITSAKSLLPSKMTIIGMEGQNLTMSLWWGARWNPQHTLSSPDVPRLLLQSFLLTTYEHPLFSSFFFPMQGKLFLIMSHSFRGSTSQNKQTNEQTEALLGFLVMELFL